LSKAWFAFRIAGDLLGFFAISFIAHLLIADKIHVLCGAVPMDFSSFNITRDDPYFWYAVGNSGLALIGATVAPTQRLLHNIWMLGSGLLTAVDDPWPPIEKETTRT